MEPYNASIVRSQALASYSKMGIAIPMGDDALRVHLHTVDFVNTKFDVACYRKPPEGLETVSIDVQNETVYLDLNECADRWHLSKEKILDAYVKNGLSVYLRQKTRKFNVLDKIVEHYEAVSRCYEECSPNFLLSKGPEAAIFIQKKTLMKIISLFHKKLESSHPGRSFRIHFSEKAITKYEAMNFSEILCFGTADHEYYLINEPMKTKLLSGSFGNVFKAQNIGIGKFAAIKEARMDYTEEEDGQVEERKAMANKGILAPDFCQNLNS